MLYGTIARNKGQSELNPCDSVGEFKSENSDHSLSKLVNCLMFFSPLMSNHAEKSSVEDRLKRNKYKLQRGSGDMDRGFLKK